MTLLYYIKSVSKLIFLTERRNVRVKKESDMLPIVISLVPTAVWFFIIYMVAVPDVNIINEKEF